MNRIRVSRPTVALSCGTLFLIASMTGAMALSNQQNQAQNTAGICSSSDTAAATTVMWKASSNEDDNNNNTTTVTTALLQIPQPSYVQNEQSYLSSLFCSNKELSSSPAEPNFFTKLQRRVRVFSIAIRVLGDYQWTKRKEKKLRKRLGIDPEDPDGDEHPEIRALWDEVHERNAYLLTEKIQVLEGFWVKVGQYLSSRADIMPPIYLKCLATLQDSMPPRSLQDTWMTIEEELSPEELEEFESIDPHPLSTASLAQVHRATLKGGHEVVLKVQHRGVASLMIQDMANLRVILQMVKFFEPDADFEPVLKEYNQEVRKELDFRTEAKNMDDVRMLLEKQKIQAIIPKTIPGMVKEKVLVMDFCHGFPVRDLELLDQYKVDRELLLERVCAAWAVQMHVGGVFNADPHMGNVLVSTRGEDASVPVLLDFGLTKRLDPRIKLAFARLMHASYESDVDGLLQSFDEMGLKMNRYDPFEDMAAMQRSFGETVPQSQAKRVAKEKSAQSKERMEAMRKEQGLAKGEKLRNPVEAWPSELVFFGRVTNMLKGMCSHLEVNHPYLRTMAVAARETLHQSVPETERAQEVIHPSCLEIDTPLQRKLKDVVHELYEADQMVGLQICVMKDGEVVGNIAAGQLGTGNPRPVTPSTCFNIFSVSKGLLTIGLLRLIQEGKVQLDDPVSKYWPEFQKDKITIRHVLTHQAGLANALPEDASLDTLLDWSNMKEYMEKADPEHEPGTKAQYHYLTFAWIVGGIIEKVTGRPYESYIDDLLSRDLDLFLGGVPNHVENENLAVLSVEKTPQVKNGSPPTPPPPRDEKTGGEGGNGDENAKAKKVLAKYRGREQLFNPSVFNMRKVRQAKLPSANGHASAESLAAVFDSLIEKDSPLLAAHIVETARTPSFLDHSVDEQSMLLDDSQACFGLGFQLHEFTLPNGKKARSLGHAGLGGSIVVAIPEAHLTVSFVTNQLSRNSQARQKLLRTVFEEYGLKAPASLQPEENQSRIKVTS